MEWTDFHLKFSNKADDASEEQLLSMSASFPLSSKRFLRPKFVNWWASSESRERLCRRLSRTNAGLLLLEPTRSARFSSSNLESLIISPSDKALSDSALSYSVWHALLTSRRFELTLLVEAEMPGKPSGNGAQSIILFTSVVGFRFDNSWSIRSTRFAVMFSLSSADILVSCGRESSELNEVWLDSQPGIFGPFLDKGWR